RRRRRPVDRQEDRRQIRGQARPLRVVPRAGRARPVRLRSDTAAATDQARRAPELEPVRRVAGRGRQSARQPHPLLQPRERRQPGPGWRVAMGEPAAPPVTQKISVVSLPMSPAVCLACVVKRTYTIGVKGKLSVADEQAPLALLPDLLLDEHESYKLLLDD